MTPKYKKIYCGVLDGWRRSLWRSSRKHNKYLFSCWSVCSWHPGLELDNPGLQVHRNTWTSFGVTERSCWKRAEQTRWLAWVHRQPWETGGTCPCKAVSLQSHSELSLQISQCWYTTPITCKRTFFFFWSCLLMYPVHHVVSSSYSTLCSLYFSC